MKPLVVTSQYLLRKSPVLSLFNINIIFFVMVTDIMKDKTWIQIKPDSWRVKWAVINTVTKEVKRDSSEQTRVYSHIETLLREKL